MDNSVDWELRKKVHEMDKELEKFHQHLSKKYNVFVCSTGCLEHNSLTLLVTDDDAQKMFSKKKYQKWLEFRP